MEQIHFSETTKEQILFLFLMNEKQNEFLFLRHYVQPLCKQVVCWSSSLAGHLTID